jgi:cellulose synthase/poly-beta-1,6-N-acetylglucosamine synthase-like glycosyltransferase
MGSLSTAITYIFLFTSVYFEVFLLITLFETRKSIEQEAKESYELAVYPSTTIIIPCWNEQNTIGGTVDSLLALDYPKDKLKLIIVDDGSKDNTWNVIQQYKGNPQISIYQKENGGKYTALNFALARTTTELVGCLDADSFVDSQALKKIVKRFENPEVMAVTPAIRIHNAKTPIQFLQYVEYNLGILLKKLYSSLNAIHVTPGPFSIFRKKVFDDLGPYRHAHNTEDMELALRMHANHYKIENCHTAWVYTVGPKTVKALYKQRVRWTHGFLENAIDYRHLFLRRKYGNLGMFTLPAAVISIVGFLVLFSMTLFRLAGSFQQKIQEWYTIGFHLRAPHLSFSWFYFNTRGTFLISLMLFCLTIYLIVVSKKIVENNTRFGKDLVLFVVLYPIISPFWMVKSVYNTAFSRKSSWR